ncbi:hypothetical protein ACIBAG_15095 [Streptomyces sp. NPDC051243]|uniref:hypothetical protein n=1 Tax=Streptomyces sp. NPDC051243 TaxID=3365646 RepID=UPI0037A96760
MITALASTFLFVHGLVHLAVWRPRASTARPFNPRHSWALAWTGLPWAGGGSPGRAQPLPGEDMAAVCLASITAMLYVIAGAATAAQSGGRADAAVLAATVGLLLKALWFHPWLSLGVLLDIGVIATVALSWPGSLY